jgi:sialate O-acetylesterase
MKFKYLIFTAAFIIVNCQLSVINSFAQPLATPDILSSNMVLQRGQKVPVWGTAKPKENIQALFGRQRLKTRADADGKWRVELPPMQADKTPQSLIIKGKDSTIVFENVLVGEVWLCSGQSNMEYSVKRNPKFLPPAQGEDLEAIELTKSANPMLRVFNQDRNGKPVSWQVVDGKTIETTSSAGYFFAKQIQEKLDVPVGVITAAIGGTLIETWTTTAMYENYPVFAAELQKSKGRIGGARPGNSYKTMIAPLVPFSVKGFLWYQGENNCVTRDRRYAEKYRVLVESWREIFGVPDAPFYCVLLAPHIYSDRRHNNKTNAVTAEELPIFREQQKKGVSLLPNSDYVVITDLVDKLTDIHPPYKWEVGARLARLALAKNYGFSLIEYSGPRVEKTETAGDSIVVTFSHTAEGLKTSDGRRVSWFEIAAADGVFRPAFAEIRGKDKVVVYLPEIKQPVKVRFGWHETAVPNLVNSEGLPATPFICN